MNNLKFQKTKIDTKQPLVSVLMTVYNREKYIAEAIESVLSSSYTNFELIIVDDCSKDRSVEIARKYEKLDKRIKVYVNEKNLGDYPNRNKAASYAKGKYIKYLDADDKIYYYGLDAMVYAMEKHPEAAFGLSHSKPEELIPYPYSLNPENAYIEHFLGRGLFNSGPTGSIINRTIFNIEGMFSTKQFMGDTDLWLRLGAKYSIIKMAPGLIWWRQHSEQQIVLERKNTDVLAIRFINDLKFLNSTACPLSNNIKLKAIKKQKQHFARKILAMCITQKTPLFAWKVYRKSKISFFELLKGFKHYE